MEHADTAVAFIVPVFNKAAALPPVLAALAGQQGGFRRSFVFVDDGSTDGSAALLEAFRAAHPSETIVIAQANAGSARATNVGVAAATTPFLKFCDADDILEPDATRRLLDVLRPSPAVLAWGDRQYFRDVAGEVRLGDLPDEAPAPRWLDEPLWPALRNSLFNPSQFLVRRDAVVSAGGCDERIVFSQEYSLTLRLARLGAFLHLPRRVCWVLDAQTGRLSNDNRRQLQRVTRAVALFLQDHPDLPRSLQRAAWRRSLGRVWKHHRRTRGAGVLSRWHRRALAAYLPFTAPRDFGAAIEVAAAGFEVERDPTTPVGCGSTGRQRTD